MSTGSLPTTSTRRPLPPHSQSTVPAVRWRSWLLRDETAWTLRMMAAMVLGGVLAWLVTDKVYLGALALGGLFLSAWHLWIPREFAIDSAGLEIAMLGRRRRIGWHAIRRVEMLDDGILFWIDRRASAWSKSPRSLYIPQDGNRAEVSRAIAEFVAGSSSGSSSHARKQAV
jgi:hypothetical protein